MSDEDKNKTPETDDSQFNDDFESLSDEEKSAFEKIMSEIATAEGKPAAKPAESEHDDALNETATSAPSDTNQPVDGADELKTGSDDDSSKDAGGDMPPDEASARSEKTPQKGSEENDDELTGEQQAALDKIMAEIESQTQPDKKPEASASDTTEAEADNELSDDQQAALDKIMDEINQRKEAPAPSEAETAPSADETETAPSADEAENDLSDDQQAALDKIMAEIKSSGQSDDTEQSDGSDGNDATETDAGHDAEDSDLSIEEFNEELTHLLSDADEKVIDDETDKPPKPSPVQESAKNQDVEPQERTAPHTILKEVNVPANAAGSAGSKNVSSGVWPARIKSALRLSAAISVIIALIGLGVWAYRFFDTARSLHTPKTAVVPASSPPPTAEQVAVPTDAPESHPPVPAHAAAEPQMPLDSPFALIRHDLESAREKLAAKRKELKDLKAYYQKGVLEEQSKIVAEAATAKLTGYQDAMKNSHIELSLHSIQRRMIYMAKLDTPLNQINAALEELLFWQRRAQLLELLSNGISGIPDSEFKQEVERITRQHLENSQKLSIENIKVPRPGLEAIWKELTNKNAGRRADTARKFHPSNKDLAIGKEICDGNFEHLYLLTNITDEAAACLIRWSGKDLYLNELTHLSPAVARSLAQWPGERLSLNGIKSLSAESAKYLSHWSGKWLSLNGLTRLSNEATSYLAQWQGEQLEMVGLNSIGRWENYVTRLYLSEQLRRKLDMQ